jgi:lipopolysaccharide transport system ATP-binding protein
MWIHIEGRIDHPETGLQIGYAVYSDDGTLMYWTCHTDVVDERWPKLGAGEWTFRSRFPSRLLNEGKYRVELLAALYYREWLIQPGVQSPSIDIDIQGGLSDSPYWLVRRPGVLAPVMDWDVTRNG